LETFAKICVVPSLETLREDPTVRIRDKQASWKLLSKISRTAPGGNVVSSVLVHRLYIRYPGYETLARTPMVAVHSKIPIRVVNYFCALYVFVGRYDYTTDSTSLFVRLKVS